MQADVGGAIEAPTTLAGVRAALGEVLHRRAEDIPLAADLEADLGVDSLAMIEISVALEERFGIRVPPSASPEDLAIRTVADVVRFVEERRAAGAGAAR